MLHRHVIALFDEAVVCVDIASWSDNRLCSCRMINTCCTLWSETFLASVKHYGVLEMLVPRLIHSLRSALFSCLCVLVKARAWYFELEALSIENLVIVEAR